jgi:hypothetical protein
MKVLRFAAVFGAAVVLALATGATGTSPGSAVEPSASAPAADSPSGFLYGTDSFPVTVSGGAPYQAPVVGGDYGGYVGMIGNWASWMSCSGGFIAWSSANSSQADTNYDSYGIGIGTAGYWFMGGPGVDPSYNGSTAEAFAWGERQAASALTDVTVRKVTYPEIIMDVELPGIRPASDNGWNSVYTSSCSGVRKANYVPFSVDRADLDGFEHYILEHSNYAVGVYSSPAVWTSIFGTGSASIISNVDIDEWTYEPETASLSAAPSGWCLRGSSSCAQFFGGVTSASSHALMWQWSGGGGVRNAYGDFDQIDVSRARLAAPTARTGEITGYAGKCVDNRYAATGNGNPIDIYGCNGTAAQHWTFTSSGELRNAASGKCLNDANYGGQGTRMIQWTCGYSDEQWTHTSSGQYVLDYNGLCLNDPGYSTRNLTQLIIWKCGSYANELWSLPH